MNSNFKQLKHFYYIILVITKINYCEFNNNVNQRFFANATAMNFFRFRDFEPRNAFKTELLRTSENKRKPRGFQFHTDVNDFNVDLEFIVPFIHIPIERSMTATQSAFRSLLNLNVQSIFTTATIVAIGGVFAIILKIIFNQYALIGNYRKSFRSNHDNVHTIFNQTYYTESDSELFLNLNSLATIIETKLLDNNVNISQCIQSSLCSYAQENFYNANKRCNDGLPQILNGVSSLHFIQNHLSGTSIKKALDAAKNGDICSKVFNNCNLSFSPNMVFNILKRNLNFLNIT